MNTLGFEIHQKHVTDAVHGRADRSRIQTRSGAHLCCLDFPRVQRTIHGIKEVKIAAEITLIALCGEASDVLPFGLRSMSVALLPAYRPNEQFLQTRHQGTDTKGPCRPTSLCWLMAQMRLRSLQAGQQLCASVGAPISMTTLPSGVNAARI